MTSTIHSITFDCADPRRVVEFWARTLGYAIEVDEEGGIMVPPDGAGRRLLFLRVPEGKSVKNRVHLDLTPVDSIEAGVERIVGLGGRRIRVFHEGGGLAGTWTLMQDPEGNELCVELGPQDMDALVGPTG